MLAPNCAFKILPRFQSKIAVVEMNLSTVRVQVQCDAIKKALKE